jgi:hypothetical protein
MSDKQTSGKESGSRQKVPDVARPPKEQAPLSSEALAGEAWQLATSRPKLLLPADVLVLQNTLGNEAVQRLLDPAAGLVQRTPTAPTPSALASTPGRPASALPTAVQTAYQARLNANDLPGALNVVVQHMASAGEIDMNLLQTQANPGSRQSVCHGADCFIVAYVPGAFTSYCAEIISGGTKLPNPRIELNENTIRNPTMLHTTLRHEYRHVQQHFAEINQSTTASGPRDCLNCNSPSEMDAYLSEIETGYDPPTMASGFSRVHVMWGYLAAEQRAIFQSRKTAADAKMARLYPGLDWDANGEVIAYRARSEALIAAHERRNRLSRPFYCDSLMAPLNPGTRSGQPAGGGGTPAAGTGAPAS